MSESGIFKAAVRLNPDQRAAFLDQACGTNEELRREIESLLLAHDASGNFLQDVPDQAKPTIAFESIAERPGAIVGAYKLKEQIGEGGMGLVFVAEQQPPQGTAAHIPRELLLCRPSWHAGDLVANDTDVDPTTWGKKAGTLEADAILALAKHYQAKGVHRFGVYESTAFVWRSELRWAIRQAGWLFAEPSRC